MLFKKNEERINELTIDEKVFSFSAENARIFFINENQFVLTDFDINAVSRFNGTDEIEAISDIFESNNVNPDNFAGIITDSLGKGSIYQQHTNSEIDKLEGEAARLRAKIIEFKNSIIKFERDRDAIKANIAKNVLDKYNKELIDVNERINELKSKEHK